MDKKLRAQIVGEVRGALKTIVEGYGEQYLTESELSKQYQMLTPGWLKRNGSLLPRVQAVVTDENGKQHKTGWAYPKNKIAKMVEDGSIERLKAKRAECGSHGVESVKTGADTRRIEKP